MCLLLALVLLVLGFAMLFQDGPSTPLELHEVRSTGDLVYQERLESSLARKRNLRVVVIVGLFSGAVLSALLAFLVMDDSKKKTTLR